ncbi:MAG TPA: RAMP superfamily CRISPR-associated protein [Saprospiraceae bacterium]|nr:RAMP superfamily CRISPR-associated protein [Saprospiraceae bacterium]HNG13973.1 RAMP superfamily CRISPR-associated protein [Saprospiraceae bacterium]HNJ64018.1 RAMP superfamily CRISPR-associated protein [Saprospiraceae bacterium]
MKELGKNIIEGKLRIVTPVHVGGAQDKHLQRGIDYVVKDNQVHLLDEKKIISHFDIDKYANALAENKLGNLLNNLNLANFSKKTIKGIAGEIGTDIKINVKNSLSGLPIIPGSSLKGALRSVIYNKAGGGQNNDERALFGGISMDIFRYMVVHDTEFQGSQFMNTKTYNLFKDRHDISGGWKHNLNGQNNEKFSPNGFTFPCEMLCVNDAADFRIVLNTKALDSAIQRTKVSTNETLKALFSADTEKLLEAIRSYTDSYLSKEIKYFETFQGENSELIIEELIELQEKNTVAPLLRLGLGAGFHAVTGDTLHESHNINGFGNRNRGMLDDKVSAKSRKIAFRRNGDEMIFMPMGFVQLCTGEVFNKNYKAAYERFIERLNAQQPEAPSESVKPDVKPQLIEDQHGPEEKFTVTDISNLKKAKWIDCEVIGQEGVNLIVEAKVSGTESTINKIRYAVGMEKGAIIQIICSSPNGKILQFQGALRKKV